jgi:hypothetical protein
LGWVCLLNIQILELLPESLDLIGKASFNSQPFVKILKRTSP